jgi:tetratricopeptide (TPR) repeat protein
VWQERREALHTKGFEIVTVAMDTGGWEAARPFLEAAHTNHPALIDQEHSLDSLLGIVNVPSGVWIDETGTIVRPPEPAFARPFAQTMPKVIAAVADYVSDIPSLPGVLDAARNLPIGPGRRVDPDRYYAALLDWIENGAASAYVLSPSQVIERSHPTSVDVSAAAAHFELAQHLHRQGMSAAAVAHFEQAIRLQPENWTYKCQAWACMNPGSEPTEGYNKAWLEAVNQTGIENYYERLEL